MKIIVVDRISDTKPLYCIHGETFCALCSHACWLGTETLMSVTRDDCQPVCGVCANEMEARGLLPETKKIRHVQDHLRADGPHEEST